MSPKRLPGLWRRGGIYQYRVRVPVDLIGVLGTARINRTLGTASYRDALLNARIVALDLESRFQCAREAGAMPSVTAQPTGRNALPLILHTSLGVTLSDAWQRYLSDPASSRSEKSALAYTTVRNLVVALIGADTQMDRVDRQDCRRVLEILRALPRNYEKRWGEITPGAAATRAKREGIDPMSISNANGYMQKFSSLFNWAVKEELVARNPCRGLRIADPIADRDRRLPFSKEQLEAIFSGSIYANLSGIAAGHEKPMHAAKHFVPLISAFSGMRQNEICQLATDDIAILDGVACFIIRADTAQGKRLKTAASQRIVPIHRALLSARLLDHWARCRASGERRLWPELRLDKFGYASVHFSKWFARYLAACGAAKPRTCFHSFRHCFRDALRAARVDRDIAHALGGWASANDGGGNAVADAYGAGYPVAVLSEALDRITYDVKALSPLDCL